MKIAITTGAEGTFILSPNIQRRIIEQGCSHAKRKSVTELWGPDWPVRFSTGQSKLPNLVNIGNDLILDDHEALAARTCPVLTKAVEELTQIGFSYFSSVRVVEIPDGVNFTIVRDGWRGEIVIEKTRTWAYDASADQVHHYEPITKAWGVLSVDGVFTPFPPKEKK